MSGSGELSGYCNITNKVDEAETIRREKEVDKTQVIIY